MTSMVKNENTNPSFQPSKTAFCTLWYRLSELKRSTKIVANINEIKKLKFRFSAFLHIDCNFASSGFKNFANGRALGHSMFMQFAQQIILLLLWQHYDQSSGGLGIAQQ